ncbi:MAG: hypothetical protein NT131_06015 [Methanomassiliicoccales archaeon]|nr:hypothetical protein [Methanomassiliicoccales archaeon]
MRTKGNTASSRSYDNMRSEGNGTIPVNVKTCQSCGHVFVEGYHGSLGIQFWLSALTFFGGIAYWALRGRGERCPRCKKRRFSVRYCIIHLGIMNWQDGAGAVLVAPTSGSARCSACGREALPDSVHCEGCGSKL